MKAIVLVIPVILAMPAAGTAAPVTITVAGSEGKPVQGTLVDGPLPDWAADSPWLDDPVAASTLRIYETQIDGFRIEALADGYGWSDPSFLPSRGLGGLTATWYPDDYSTQRYRFTRTDGRTFGLNGIDFGRTVSDTYVTLSRSLTREYVDSLEPYSPEWLEAMINPYFGYNDYGAYRNVRLVGTTRTGKVIEQTISSFADILKSSDDIYPFDMGIFSDPVSVTLTGLTDLVSLEIEARVGSGDGDPTDPDLYAETLLDVCQPGNLAAVAPEIQLEAICNGTPFDTTGPYANYTDIDIGLALTGDLDVGATTTLRSLAFEVSEAPPIPLPASWLALAGGIAALGGLGRLRRTGAARRGGGSL